MHVHAAVMRVGIMHRHGHPPSRTEVSKVEFELDVLVAPEIAAGLFVAACLLVALIAGTCDQM